MSENHLSRICTASLVYIFLDEKLDKLALDNGAVHLEGSDGLSAYEQRFVIKIMHALKWFDADQAKKLAEQQAFAARTKA